MGKYLKTLNLTIFPIQSIKSKFRSLKVTVEKKKDVNFRTLGILIGVLLFVVSVVCVYFYFNEESFDEITWVG